MENSKLNEIADNDNSDYDRKVTQNAVDPCLLPKTLTMGTWAPELDHVAMEEGVLVWWIFLKIAYLS